jgi:iron complex transport system permease protein
VTTTLRTGDQIARETVRSDHRLRGWGLVAAVGLLVLAVGASLALGAKSIPFDVVLDALRHADGGNDHDIVRSLRVPRTVVGLFVGAALGLAGAIMQGVTRNPLADPGLLGVESGAALAVVLAIRHLRVTSVGGTVWFAFAGAAVAGVAVYLVGSAGRGGPTPVKLAIAGGVITAVCGSATAAILVVDLQTFAAFRQWQVGSLAGSTGEIVRGAAPFVVVGLLVGLSCTRPLDALALGDDVARSLGGRLGAYRVLCAVAVVLLAGTAVAVAGPIGFVGLTVPHVARAVCGPDHRWLLPWSAVLGALLILTADVAGRLVARPGELEVGLVTALVGAPVFLTLVRRRRVAEL